jgi:putative peptidoglycan lipid II flippase
VYYALQDYKTPLRSSIVSIIVSAIASIALAYPLRNSPYGAAAIALGTALGSYMNLSLLVRGLHQRIGPLYTAAMWMGSRRIAIASAFGGLVAFALSVLIERTWPGVHPRIAGPPILVTFGVSYLGLAWWLGSGEAARWLRLAPRVRAAA